MVRDERDIILLIHYIINFIMIELIGFILKKSVMCIDIVTFICHYAQDKL